MESFLLQIWRGVCLRVSIGPRMERFDKHQDINGVHGSV